MDGTIYISGKVIDGAIETLEFLKEQGKKVIFLTNNSSVSAKFYVEKLKNMGITTSLDEVYTAGNATEEFLLENYKDKTVYLLGTNELKSEFIDYGINVVEDESADIAVLAYDKEITYKKLVTFTNLLNMGKPYIATHPDINCPALPFYQPDIGAMIKMIEASTKRLPDVVCGKPFDAIIEGVTKKVKLPCDKIAMVGDRLNTDIAFGNKAGFTSILVLSGEATKEDHDTGENKAKFVIDSIKSIKTILKS